MIREGDQKYGEQQSGWLSPEMVGFTRVKSGNDIICPGVPLQDLVQDLADLAFSMIIKHTDAEYTSDRLSFKDILHEEDHKQKEVGQ